MGGLYKAADNTSEDHGPSKQGPWHAEGPGHLPGQTGHPPKDHGPSKQGPWHAEGPGHLPPIKSKRIRKTEQVYRCHCEMLLGSEADVDDELLGWLEDAARLVSQPKAGRPARQKAS